jgi:hypothetical protein
MFVKPLAALLLAVLLLVVALPASAQLGLPRLPSLPALPEAQRAVRPVERELAPPDLRALRRRTVDALLRADRARFERDPAGEPVLRGEVALLGPDEALLAAARAEGFSVLRERVLDALDLRVVVLGAPPGLPTADAVQRLRALAPGAAIDFNHVYTGSGEVGGAATAPGAAPAADAGHAVRIGLVDSAPDLRHPALRAAQVQLRGCDQPPAPHGTAVASLLVGQDGRFRGVLPNATLYAADVRCGDGAADALAGALGWLARERVAVINVSLVGPHNRLLEHVMRALAARGHVVVAAVGNDGPAAPPLYPAAYPGAVGVTGVDMRRRVLPEALWHSPAAATAARAARRSPRRWWPGCSRRRWQRPTRPRRAPPWTRSPAPRSTSACPGATRCSGMGWSAPSCASTRWRCAEHSVATWRGRTRAAGALDL